MFQRAVVGCLLRQKRTVILVTNRIQFLAHAHHIVVLNEGQIATQGSWSNIEEEQPEICLEWRRRMAIEEEQLRRREQESENAREKWRILKAVAQFGFNKAGRRRSKASSSRTSPSITSCISFHAPPHKVKEVSPPYIVYTCASFPFD